MRLQELMESPSQRIPTRFFHETSYSYALKILQTGGIKPLWDTHPDIKQQYIDQAIADGEEPVMQGGNETYATTFTYAPHGHGYFGGLHDTDTLAMFMIDATKLAEYPNEIQFWPDLEAGLVIVNGNMPISSFAGIFIHAMDPSDPAVAQLVEVCKFKNIPAEIGDSAARSRAINRFKG